MEKERLVSAAVAASLLVAEIFGNGMVRGDAMARTEIAAIHAEAAESFRYWRSDAAALKALEAYVEAVTDPANADYIPPEDRVAVFDFDGTLMGERSPSYFEWMMYVHRALEDPSYEAGPEDRAIAEDVRTAMQTGGQAHETGDVIAQSMARVFDGMPVTAYEAYVRAFIETPVPGFSHLARGEAFFLPMQEVLTYLATHDFDLWIISGSDRDTLRVLAGGVLSVRRDHVIGKDVEYRASGKEADGSSYDYQAGDTIVRATLRSRAIRMDKVAAIVREIGRQPVLASGNSMGDASMLCYTLDRNPHRAMVFALLADDTKREYGSEAVADAMRSACAENGWMPISMRDDWVTIYGEDVHVRESKPDHQ